MFALTRLTSIFIFTAVISGFSIIDGRADKQIKRVGETAHFSCKLSDPYTHIFWERKNIHTNYDYDHVIYTTTILENSSRIMMNEENPWHNNLTIINVTKEDEGSYVCVANKTSGKRSMRGYLTVLDPIPVTAAPDHERLSSEPGLIRAVINQTKLVGETAFFSFPYFSLPGIHSNNFWMHFKKDEFVYDNNVTTYLEDKSKIVESEDPNDGPEILTIYNVTKEHEGWYVSVGTNTFDKIYSKGYLTVLDPSAVTSWSKHITAAIAALMTFILAIVLAVIVKLKRDKQKVIQTTKELMSEQWTKIVSIERVLSNGNNDGTHTLRMPVVTIEKQKLMDVKKNYTYSVLPSEYVLPLDATWEISKEDVTLQKVLGEGEFGKVMKAGCFGLPNSSRSETVAVKMLKDGHSDDDMIAFVSEMEIMKMVGKHENIVNLLGCCTRDGAPFIIVEYAENGCLREFLRKHKPGYNYDLITHCCAFHPDDRPTFSELKEKLQAIELKTLD